MLKKLVCLVIILFGSTSLFAFTAGEKIIYPGFGIGISSGDAKGISGSDMGVLMGGNSSLFKNGENDVSFAYSIGAMFDYFMTDSLALTSGLSYDRSPYKLTYPKNTATEDLEFTVDFAFLTVPIGFHYYYENFLLIGGGFYFGKTISDDSELKYGSTKEDVKLETKNDIGLFLDLGLNFELSETNNILAYVRYKRGLSNVYDEEDVVTDIKMRTLTLNLAYGIKF